MRRPRAQRFVPPHGLAHRVREGDRGFLGWGTSLGRFVGGSRGGFVVVNEPEWTGIAEWGSEGWHPIGLVQGHAV